MLSGLKIIKNSLFNKVLIIFILITTVAVMGLSWVVYSNVERVLWEKELKYNTQLLYNMNLIFERKRDIVDKILKQVYSDSFGSRAIFNFWETEVEPLSVEYLALKPPFDNAIYNLIRMDASISSIILTKDLDKKVYVYSSSSLGMTDNLPFGEFQDFHRIEALNSPPQREYILPAYSPTYYRNGSGTVFSVGAQVRRPGTNSSLGFFIIDFDTDLIDTDSISFEKQFGGMLLIVNRMGDVIYDSSKKYYGGKFPFIDNILGGNTTVSINGGRYLLNVYGSPKNETFAVGLVPESLITDSITQTRNMIVTIAIACILAVILLVYPYIGFLSLKVRRILDTMNKVRSGNLSERISTSKAKDELTQISSRFNEMCDDLQEYINKVYLSGIYQKNAQITALRAQVNPHFLYNTLETIRMYAVAEGNEVTAQMIYNLAGIFRSSIKDEPVVTIARELEFCRSYLELYSIRYEDSLTVRFDIEESITELGIISHLLQPVIENYIVHGYDLRTRDNTIRISGNLRGDKVIITIQDNGLGIPSERLDTLRQDIGNTGRNGDSGIGLVNVNERIRLICGQAFGLSIDSEENKGTTVVLTLPAKTKEELMTYLQSYAG